MGKKNDNFIKERAFSQISANHALLFAFLLFVSISGTAFADGSVSSVDTSISATSATTGTNAVLTATSTASSEDVSNVQILLVKDSGSGDFSVSDPSGGYYTATVTTSGTAKTFTFTAGVAGTYTYHVTDTWSGGSKSSTTETLSFIAPSALSVSGSASTATLTQGQSTSLTINVQNSQSSNVLTSYSLSYDSSYLSLSGDPTSSSGTTISVGTTKSLSWTITHSTCFTGTKSVVFALGDNTDAHTLTVTGNSSCGSSSSSSTSSGGGGSSNVTSNATKEAKLFSTTAGVSKLLTFTQTTTGITEIELKTVAAKTSIQVSVDVANKPSGAPEPAVSVYKYMGISSTAPNSDFSTIKIKFKVPKSWVTTNSVDASTIALYRYAGGWTKLTTTQTDSDSSYYYFEAVSPGFSTFAVAAEKGAATTPSTPTPTPTPSTPSAPGTTPEPTAPAGNETGGAPGTPSGPLPGANAIIGIVVLILAIGFGLVYHFFLKSGKYKHRPLKEVYASAPGRQEKPKYDYTSGRKR